MDLHYLLFLAGDVFHVAVVPHLRTFIHRLGLVALVPRCAFFLIKVQDVDLVVERHALGAEDVVPRRLKHALGLTLIGRFLCGGSKMCARAMLACYRRDARTVDSE